MSKTAMVNARIEPKLKSEDKGILRRLGLSTTQAVTLFFKHVKNDRGLPFDVRLPNATTRRAIEDVRNCRNLKRFASKDKMINELSS